jgi:hypothetical protein
MLRSFPARTIGAVAQAFEAGGAAQITEYVEAGCNWLSIWNLLPYTLDAEAAQAHMALDIELCNRVKASASQAGR